MGKREEKKKQKGSSSFSSALRTAVDWMQQAQTIVLSTHEFPDGDGLGSEVALYYYFKKAQKRVCVWNADSLPDRYRFLDPKQEIFKTISEHEKIDPWDLWIILDTNDPKRVGPLWKKMGSQCRNILFLDHHLDLNFQEGRYPSHALVAVDAKRGSLAEILWLVFQKMNWTEIDAEIALGLYVSVMTDTNSFRNAETTALAHQIAASALEKGICAQNVYQAIYASKRFAHLELLGKVLQNIQKTSSERVVWLEVPLFLKKRYEVVEEDLFSFLNFLLLLKKPQIVCLFREEEGGIIRTSLKSKGRVPVHEIALQFGGGGHAYAAGMKKTGTIAQWVSQVVPVLEEQVKTFEKTGKKR